MGKIKAALGGVGAYEAAKHMKKHYDERRTNKTEPRVMRASKGAKIVLSCDGGGVRGLVTAQFLYRLEEAAGRPLHELFDLYAGTSVGAIVVASIACKKAPMSEAVDFYSQETLDSIFHKSLKDRILHKAQGSPKYDGKGTLSPNYFTTAGKLKFPGRQRCD